MTVTRWGVLGTARITSSFISAIQKSKVAKLVMVGSREPTRAANYASKFNISESGSYQDVLAHPEIDAVYILLPNEFHFEWALKAIQAKKHVLVEKPIVLSLDNLEWLISEAEVNNVAIAEAFMYQFHPAVQKLQELLADDAIGTVQQASFTFAHNISGYLSGEDNYRYYRQSGGGSFYDLGCYGVHLFLGLFGIKPVPEILYSYQRPFDAKTIPKDQEPADESTTVFFKFGDVYAEVVSSFSFHGRRLWISGTDGEIIVDDIISSSSSSKTIQLHNYTRDYHENFDFPPIDTYQLQLDHFSRSVQSGTQLNMSFNQTKQTLNTIIEVLRVP